MKGVKVSESIYNLLKELAKAKIRKIEEKEKIKKNDRAIRKRRKVVNLTKLEKKYLKKKANEIYNEFINETIEPIKK